MSNRSQAHGAYTSKGCSMTNKPCLQCDKIIKTDANWRLCSDCRRYANTNDAEVEFMITSIHSNRYASCYSKGFKR